MFAIHRPDASFFGYMPLESPIRAASVGLRAGDSFQDLVTRVRPGYVSLGLAYAWSGDGEGADRRDWLTAVAGYRYLAHYDIYERTDLGTGRGPASEG